MGVTSSKSLVEEFDLEELQSRAQSVLSRVSAIFDRTDTVGMQLSAMYADAVSDIERVRIAPLAPCFGTFLVGGGELTLSEEPIARLLHEVARDVAQDCDSGGTGPEDIFDLMVRVVAVFMLHELRHRTQGVERMEDVQLVKATGGPQAMANLDLLADRDAAFAYALAFAQDDTDGTQLRGFQEALYFSVQYYLKVFPPTPDRPDKVGRALGILLMAARLAHAEIAAGFEDDPLFPLDTPIIAHVSPNYTEVAIYRAAPRLELLDAANDREASISIIREILAGRIDDAFERCIRFVGKWRKSARR